MGADDDDHEGTAAVAGRGRAAMADDAPTRVQPSDVEGPLRRYTAGDFIIGLALVLGASVANAAGLNLTKLDHARQQVLARDQRSSEWKRPLWLGGMTLYIASQLVGSSLALQYLRAEWVAPLSSSSLIFNFLFARLIVGTKIVRLDIIGTAVIIVGVVGIVAFSNVHREGYVDRESNLDLELLKSLWGRGGWIAYFILLQVGSLLVLWFASIMADVVHEREDVDEVEEEEGDRMYRRRAEQRAGQQHASFWTRAQQQQRHARKLLQSRIETWAHSRPDSLIRKIAGFLWAFAGGMLSGQTLCYAKQTLKLGSNGEPSQFASFLPIVIVLLLIVTGVAQIVCLNRSLLYTDSTVTVPVFTALYSITAFSTSLVGLDQVESYSNWVLAAICLSIAVLVAGVATLSLKKVDTGSSKRPPRTDALEDGDGDAMPMDEHALPVVDKKRASALLNGDSAKETVWDAGDDDEPSDHDEGGYKHVRDDDDDFGGFVESSKT